MPDATTRFSDRVDNYVKYRPSYPAELLDFLFREKYLRLGDTVGDIGSGTGIFTKLLLEKGLTVCGVEPNGPMRAAAEAYLAPFGPQFISMDGRAEATGLGEKSLDAITCAQAFHWVDPVAAKREFARVLKPGAPVIVIWNNRSVDADAFAAAYDQILLKHGVGYQRVKNSWVVPDAIWQDFFEHGQYVFQRFDNRQTFDWEGLLGRSLSASYVPSEQDPAFPEFQRQLRLVYDQHQQNGLVSFTYHTEVYIGKMERGIYSAIN